MWQYYQYVFSKYCTNKSKNMSKKIMFNDKFCLTKAVLDGAKTMTRRVLKDNVPLGNWEETKKHLPYKVGEVIAIAQPYKDIIERLPMHSDAILGVDGIPRKEFKAGWTNKMFVKADLMSHHIKITDVKVERLRDISDDDCLCEGIKFRYVNMNFGNSMDREDYYYEYLDRYGEKDYYGTNSPKKTFSIFIDKICGYGTWESNPWVVAYSFELVD